MEHILGALAGIFVATWFLTIVESICTFLFVPIAFRYGPVILRKQLPHPPELGRYNSATAITTDSSRVKVAANHAELLFYPRWRFGFSALVKGKIYSSADQTIFEIRPVVSPFIAVSVWVVMVLLALFMFPAHGILLLFLVFGLLLFALSARASKVSARRCVEDLEKFIRG